MAFFPDLAHCSYFRQWEDSLTAIGWLESGHEFIKGTVSETFFTALVRLCVDPWQPVVFFGYHRCQFCRFSEGPTQLHYQELTVELGNANVFVPGTERVYVAPTSIVHYIDAHEYAPPLAFQDAVLHCPKMKSFSYFKVLGAHGIK